MVPSNRKLSDRQSKMLEFISDFVKEHPYPPSVREIQMGCSIRLDLGGGLQPAHPAARGLHQALA